MADFLEELRWRDLIHDVTPGLAERLARGPVTGYVGFDPTAPSLQIGNLVAVMLLAHLQRAGGTPVALVGAGTAMIGDPSGRSEERPLLTVEQIDANAARMRDQLSRFLAFDGVPNAARMVDNADWLRTIPLVDFLRDTGKHFTIAWMLQKESVKSRMETGISYTEFSYMLLQAYDFLHLFQTHECELQMGGSDQWGNITAGAELIRRTGAGDAHALSAPLLTTAGGKKFGKTAEGAVWLDRDLTSPYKFYQFWINSDDRDVEHLLKVFTFLDRQAIADLMRDHGADPSQRLAQHALASEMTARVHGDELTNRAQQAAALMFGDGDVRTADKATLETIAAEVPGWATTRAGLPNTVVDLAAAAGLTKSKGEARRQLQQGGIYVNGERASADMAIADDSILAGEFIWLRRGKKTDVLVRVT